MTNPAAETMSIGLLANASLSWFLHRHLDYFIMTQNFTAIYQDLVPSNSFSVSLGFSATYQDWQKTLHRDTDGT
jgi:hypothetical protein